MRHGELIRPVSCALLLAVASCGTPPKAGPDGGASDACTSQIACDAELRRVCEAGWCSAQLPANELQTLYMSLRGAALFGERVSMRIFVLYPITPAGQVVTCDGLVDKVAVADLLDPRKYNLTTPADVRPAPGNGDTIVASIVNNGAGRVIYAEIYPQSGGEGTPTGVGCVADVPYVAGTDPGIVMKVE